MFLAVHYVNKAFLLGLCSPSGPAAVSLQREQQDRNVTFLCPGSCMMPSPVMAGMELRE